MQQPMPNYQRLNNIVGWLCFAIAGTTYFLTMEPSASYWDCGEFISCIYRMQVAHQPGAPLFTMLYKVFTLLAGDKDRKSVVSGKSVYVSVDLGGRRIIKKKKNNKIGR